MGRKNIRTKRGAQSLSHVWIFVTLWTVALQVPVSIGFSKQENWSGLPFLPPEDLPDPGIEPVSPALHFYFISDDKCFLELQIT